MKSRNPSLLSNSAGSFSVGRRAAALPNKPNRMVEAPVSSYRREYRRSAQCSKCRFLIAAIAIRHETQRSEGLEADVPCFSHGGHGATPPLIPDEVRAAFAQIGATIETDFDTDRSEEHTS